MNKSKAILFLGDVVPFKPVKFRNIYNVVINLECPIVKNANPEVGKINLSVEENYLKNIFGTNLLCASLGNNHILDYGNDGLESTLSELGKSGIKWFGIESDPNENFQPLIIEFGKIKIAFISAVCSSTSPIIELDNGIHLNLLNIDRISDRIEELKHLVQKIILYVHWGVEESSYPAAKDIIIARTLIDAGVDIIIGSHAHAPQPIEKYKNGIIAYSLGNFLMPAMKSIPSYFDVNGVPLSTYFKSLMIWNRISWGLVINLENMTFEVKKYVFLLNRIFELSFTTLDKYIKLDENIFDASYESKLEKHLEKRYLFHKMRNFIYRPYLPQKLKKYYENWSFIKF